MPGDGMLVGRITRCSTRNFMVSVKAVNFINQGDRLNIKDHGFQSARVMTIGGVSVSSVMPDQEFELRIAYPCLFGAIESTLRRLQAEADRIHQPIQGIEVFLRAPAEQAQTDTPGVRREPILAGT